MRREVRWGRKNEQKPHPAPSRRPCSTSSKKQFAENPLSLKRPNIQHKNSKYARIIVQIGSFIQYALLLIIATKLFLQAPHVSKRILPILPDHKGEDKTECFIHSFALLIQALKFSQVQHRAYHNTPNANRHKRQIACDPIRTNIGFEYKQADIVNRLQHT